MSFLEKLEEDDFIDLETSINEFIYNELINNPLLYSDKSFYNELTDIISNNYYEEWKSAELCDENDKEEIEKFIYDIVLNFFDTYEEWPHRSYYKLNHINDANETESILTYLKNIPQPKQRTMEWYEYRHNLITASSLWKVFGTESNVNSLIYEKCSPFNPIQGNKFKGGSLEWGNIFEPLSIQIYEKTYNTKIEDFGCIQHPNYEYIGASPDGINTDPSSDKFGRMLEVKNIYNREINGIPKEEYWIQMQIQLETCNLDVCDFLETRFVEYEDIEDFYNDTEHQFRGYILYFIKSNEMKYMYLPLETILEVENIEKWKNETLSQMKEEGYALIKEVYWYLDELSCVVVKRNKKWFECAVTKILEIWNTIQKEKKEGYEHRAAKKRIKTTDVYVSKDNNKHTIHNLSINNKINLIKLEE